MAAKAITFCTQLGSGGNAIARRVADHLGYRFYDREVIWEAAEISGVSPEAIAAAERWPSFVERMMEFLTTTSVVTDTSLMAPLADRGLLMRTSADYRAVIEQVVRNLAQEGNCVIVGHAGQAILSTRPEVFKVLVHGSRERRAQRHAIEEGVDIKTARDLVTSNDCKRSEFYRHAYNTEWLASSAYHVTVNTDDVNEDTAVSWVLEGTGACSRTPALA